MPKVQPLPVQGGEKNPQNQKSSLKGILCFKVNVSDLKLMPKVGQPTTKSTSLHRLAELRVTNSSARYDG